MSDSKYRSDADNGFARAQRAYDNMEPPQEQLTATDAMENEFNIVVKRYLNTWRLTRDGRALEVQELTIEEAELFQVIKDEWTASH